MKISVILLLHNTIDNGAHDKTLRCWDGLVKYTSVPFELVLVDNGSTDPLTHKWFKNLRKEGMCYDIKKIDRNSKANTCFSAGANAGIQAASNELLFFVNNDVEFNDSCVNYVRKMTEIFDFDKNIMMVGVPLTFKKAFDYGLDSNKMNVLFGFCFMKKELVNYIGYLDESYRVGMFDDDDWNTRLRRIGFKVGAVIGIDPGHDWKNSSIEKYNQEAKLRGKSLFDENRERFNDKWRRFGYEK